MRPEILKDHKVAIVIGCEGFVGGYVLKLLSKHSAYKSIKAIALSPLKVKLPKVVLNVSSIQEIEFGQGESKDLFICYDSTFFNSGGKYKIPGDQYKHIPRMILKAYKSQIGQVVLLSSKNTSSDALFHVSRSRGLIEDIVVKMGFWSTHIFKPSILVGETTGSTWGKGIANMIGNKVDNVTGGWLKENKPIEAEVVARAMVEQAQKLEKGVHYYSSAWLQDYAVTAQNKDVRKKKNGQ